MPWKQRKQVVADLQLIYRAAPAAEAQGHLEELERKWKEYPSVSQVWRRNWEWITLPIGCLLQAEWALS